MLQAVAQRLPKVSPHVMYLYGAQTRGFIIVGELEARDYQLAVWSAPRDSLGPICDDAPRTDGECSRGHSGSPHPGHQQRCFARTQ
jgi:hypothetical protein